jgi:L-iditol 2-dehydrogenase
MCPVFRASNIAPGGFAEFVRVPADLVQQTTLLLPDHLSDEEASFTEPLACCIRAVQRSALQPGDTAVVVGLGSIGLQMAQAVKALTEDVQVIGFDVLLDRVILGHKLGIDRALHPGTPDLKERIEDWTDGQGVDVVILTAGGAQALTQAIDLLCPGGLLNIFAWPPGLVAPVPLEKLYHGEMTLTTSYSASPADLRISLGLLSSGKVRVDRLISHRLHFEQFHEGVELARKQQALKVFFVNPSYKQHDNPSAGHNVRRDQEK